MEIYKIIYPNMRDELLDILSTLSNAEYQRDAWVKGKFPPGIQFDNLDLAIHFLFDDTSLGDDPKSMVGIILLNDIEVKLISNLIESLNLIFDKYGLILSDESYINKPEWVAVIQKAEEAFDFMKSNDYSN